MLSMGKQSKQGNCYIEKVGKGSGADDQNWKRLLCRNPYFHLFINTNQIMEATNITCGSIVRMRIHNRIAQAHVMQFVLVLYKTIAIVMVIALFRQLEFMHQLIIYKDYVIVKCFAAINGILFFEYIRTYLVPFVTSWAPRISFDDDETKPFSTKIAQDEVLLSDIVTFIYEKGGFPVIEAKEQFGLTVPQIKKLGDELEDVGVLVRGPNNARLINPDITQETIQKLLADLHVTIDKLDGTFVETNGNYQSLPILIKQSIW